MLNFEPWVSKFPVIESAFAGSVTSAERQMGPETIYEFDTEDNYCKNCGRHFRVSGYISEYPMFFLTLKKLTYIL